MEYDIEYCKVDSVSITGTKALQLEVTLPSGPPQRAAKITFPGG